MNFKYIALFFLLSVMIISCQNKSSPFGFPPSQTENEEIILYSNAFKTIYAYQDTISAYIGNQKLVLGNYQEINTRVLLRYVNLPLGDLSKNPIIILHYNPLTVRNPQEYNIKVAPIVETVFMENYVTWERANDEDDWKTPGGDFGDLTEFKHVFSESDTLHTVKFEIDKEIVQKWISGGTFTDNLGIIFFTDDITDSFVEFYSTESPNPNLRPQIELFYENEEEPTFRYANYDAFIYDKKHESFDENDLVISNILPASIFTQLDLSFETHEETYSKAGILNETDLKRININQAYIIFYVDDEKSMYKTSSFDINLDLALGEEWDMSTTYSTTLWRTIGLTTDNEMRIIATRTLQEVISGYREQYGFVLRNNLSNMDFSHINLSTNPELEPKIIIRFSRLIN